MAYILYTILVFNLLIIIFKFFAKYNVNNLQALIVNYFVAAGCGILFSKDEFSFNYVIHSNWLYHAIAIGFLFIVVFNFYAFGTQKVGIAITTVANKMSLVIPVAISLLIDPSDKISLTKIIGFILALIGIYLSSTTNGKLSFNKKYLWLILLVFFGQGIADAIFSNSKSLVPAGEDMQYFVVLFIIAGLSGLVILIVQSLKKPPKFHAKNIVWGIILGIPNFFSLLFMLRALKTPQLNVSQVYPLVSMGVVVVSAFIGLIIYKEKILRSNWIGIILAVCSIAIFTFAT